MKNFTPDWLLMNVIRLSGYASKYISVRGRQMHYFEKIPPHPKATVVVLHGIGASSVHFWKVMGSLYRSGYAVYVPDLPSHGLSEDLSGRVTSEDYYLSFVDWSNQVIKNTFILVGNSVGGTIGLRFELEHAARLQGLVLISPGGGFESEEEWNQFKSVLDLRTLADSKQFIKKIFHFKPIYMSLIYQPFLESMCRPGVKEMFKNTALLDFRLRDQTPNGPLPTTLLIWGKGERLFPHSHLNEFKKMLPSTVVVEEPEDFGHCPQLDNAMALSRRLLSFMRYTILAEPRPIIFFDGVCNVCNGWVDFVLKRDLSVFQFASLQGETAQKLLDSKHTVAPFKSIVLKFGNEIYTESDAILKVFETLSPGWSILGFLGRIVPKVVRDWLYRYFASHRYQWFGQRETCRLPSPQETERFLN